MSPKKEPASVKTIGSHRVGDVVELTAVRMNDQGVFLDKPIEVAKALYVREVTEKTAEFEPRARVVRVDWLESDVVRGEVIPKVVYELV